MMVGYGEFYAPRLLEEMGIPLDPGVLRMSFIHYTTEEEIDRLISSSRRSSRVAIPACEPRGQIQLVGGDSDQKESFRKLPTTGRWSRKRQTRRTRTRCGGGQTPVGFPSNGPRTA